MSSSVYKHGQQVHLEMLYRPKVNSEWMVCVSCDGQEASDSFEKASF